jgi:hypothetical protein
MVDLSFRLSFLAGIGKTLPLALNTHSHGWSHPFWYSPQLNTYACVCACLTSCGTHANIPRAHARTHARTHAPTIIARRLKKRACFNFTNPEAPPATPAAWSSIGLCRTVLPCGGINTLHHAWDVMNGMYSFHVLATSQSRV